VFNHRYFTLTCLFATFSLFTTSVNADTGKVISTIDAGIYTYVETDTGSEIIWLAGPKTSLAAGSTITVNTSKPMHDFHSKTLNRDFPVVYFVSSFTDNAATSAAPLNGHAVPAKATTLSQPIARAEGGQTIAEIIASKKELSGKIVKIRGKVTKFTANVMNKNWIHLVDGSSESDLTIITSDNAEIGQTIMIEGSVVLDKDFGYGYFYDLLIDNAKITVE